MIGPRMRLVLALAAIAGAVIVFASYAVGRARDDRDLRKADFVVALAGLGGDDQDQGLVELRAAGERKTVVAVEVFEPREGEVAEVRGGNCDLMDGSAAYALEPMLDGRSETTLDVPLAPFRRSGYLVMVRRPAPGLSGALCADLARSQPPDSAPVFE